MKDKAAILALLGITTLMCGRLAHGQAQPMPPDPYDPHQNQNTSTPAYSPVQSASMQTSDCPAAEVQAVPMALAHAAATRGLADQADRQLGRTIEQLQEDFELSADMLAATRAQEGIYDRFVDERNRVISEVAKRRDYQTYKKLCAELDEQLYELRSSPQGNQLRIEATAAQKLKYASKISAMESDALKADPAFMDVRAQLREVSERVNAMRVQFARSLKRDPNFLAARRNVEDARLARSTAAALVDGAVEARDIALDYAYWIHQYDIYKYLSHDSGYYPYGYSSYGYQNYGYTPTVYRSTYALPGWR